MGGASEEDAAVVEIVTTLATEEEALRLAKVLVSDGLVACASLRPVRSLYRWQGSLCDEPEIELVLKTQLSRATQVEKRVRDLHSYDTPAILRLPVASMNSDYSAWVVENTRQDSDR